MIELESMTSCVSDKYSNQLNYIPIIAETEGIEPPHLLLESSILPLNYVPIKLG